MASVKAIEGVGAAHAKKLAALGVRTTSALLDRGGTKAGRSGLAKSSGIQEKTILRWVNHSDLFRIRGVASQYAELLEASGVDSVAELAKRQAKHLTSKAGEVNKARRLVRRVP